MIDKERVLSHLRVIRTWAAVGTYHEGIEKKCCEDVAQWVDEALELMEALNVSPEELERLKLCRHNCKIDCLLEHYNKVAEEREALRMKLEAHRMKLEALDTEAEEAEEKLKDIWDYATVNEISWMQTAASNAECTLHTMAGELFRLKQPKVLTKYDVRMAILSSDPVFIETRDGVDKEPGDDRWAMLTPRGESLTSGEYLAMSTYITNEMLLDADYNKTWRCWDKKPTDKQKKGEVWND